MTDPPPANPTTEPDTHLICHGQPNFGWYFYMTLSFEPIMGNEKPFPIWDFLKTGII